MAWCRKGGVIEKWLKNHGWQKNIGRNHSCLFMHFNIEARMAATRFGKCRKQRVSNKDPLVLRGWTEIAGKVPFLWSFNSSLLPVWLGKNQKTQLPAHTHLIPKYFLQDQLSHILCFDLSCPIKESFFHSQFNEHHCIPRLHQQYLLFWQDKLVDVNKGDN